MLLLVWSKGGTSYRTIRPELAKENS
jgi:hypothetical protein